MTKQQLKQYRSLRHEIQHIDHTIAEYTTHATVKSATRFPYENRSVTMSGVAPNMLERASKLKQRRKQLAHQMDMIEKYVDEITDPQLHMIFWLYYIEGDRRRSWHEVAELIGENDESYPRQKHTKYLSQIHKATENLGNYML